MAYLTTDAIKSLINTLAENGTIFEASFSNVAALLKEGSYLFYEFRDKEVVKDFDSNHPEYGTYTKKISPLYVPDVINEKTNEELLSIITEETPFYHLEPSAEVTTESENISSTRDAGINDVPSALQTSTFYNTWFRESQGYVQNLLLLDVYNKLRRPFINENQYLNAKLFPTLAAENFSSTSDEDSLIEFKTSAEENAEDNEFFEGQDSGVEIAEKDRVYSKIGCIDYLNDIVNQKLASIYELVDYDSEQTNLLSSWVESKYGSGEIPYEDIETELSIYKLQDIKYELLRRKFAGSETLYKLAIASIDRQGTFVSTIPLGSLSTSDVPFKDKRILRLLDLPGVLSEKVDLSNLDFVEAFSETPLKEGTNYLPLNTLSPLFYTSASQTVNGVEYIYNTETFFNSSDASTYRSIFLRDGSSVIEWDALHGVVIPDSLANIYDTLDERIATTETTEGYRYRTLDDYVLEDEDDPSSGYIPLHLDRKRALLDSFISTGNLLDVSANKILYNKNILQSLSGDTYPYLTYPIADNNSVSLLDDPWMEYFKEAVEKKSRVQDKVAFGSQVNKFYTLDGTPVGEYHFFNVSQDKDSRFLYFKYCILKYNALNFKIISLDANTISKITLKVQEGDDDYELYQQFEDIDECAELFTYNEGVLPFTYLGLLGNKVENLALGVFEDEEVSEEGTTTVYNFHDDISKSGYTKAKFIFATTELAKNTTDLNIDPAEVEDPDLTTVYSEDVKALFYVVYKGLFTDDEGISYKKYLWSDPIRVLNFSEEYLEELIANDFSDETFKPEWMNLGYFFNPYLNFTEKSASALRNKNVNPSYEVSQTDISKEAKESLLKGPSINAALSNLTRVRGMACTCNDSGQGTLPMEWVDASQNEYVGEIFGFYLDRYHKSSLLSGESATDYDEYAYIYGDNRTADIFDGTDLYNQNVQNRTDVFSNENNKIPCIRIGKGEADSSSTYIAENYFKLLPCKHEYLYNYKTNTLAELAAKILEIIGDGTEEHPGTLPTLLENYCSGETEEQVLAKDVSERTSYEQRAVRLCEERDKYQEEYTELNSDTSIIDESYEQMIWEKWWWNRESDGISVLLNISPNFEDMSEEEIYLLRRDKEFTLSLILSDTTVKVRFFLEPDLVIESEEFTISKLPSNVRIAASSEIITDEETFVSETRLHLVVNGTSKTSIFSEVRKPVKYYEGLIWPALEDEGEFTFPLWDAGNSYVTETGYLEDIEVGCHASYTDGVVSQDHSFFGDIYDIRLYNEGLSELNLRMISAGSLRELFSYAPSAYILGYNLYKDLGISKEVHLREGSEDPLKVSSIRLFNRSVWDSILLDMYPTSSEESLDTSYRYRKDFSDPQDDLDVWGMVNGEWTLRDCIEQSLADTVEVNNNINPLLDTIQIYYAGSQKVLNNSDNLTTINTTLYPIEYKNALFSSGNAKFDFLDEDETILGTLVDYEISLPDAVDPSDNVLSYDADVSLNYTITPEFDFSVWNSHGSYIALDYNSLLGTSVAKFSISDTGSVSTTSSSQTNHILVPLTVPKQPTLDTEAVGYFDRLYLRGVQMNSGLVNMLKASNYYNELRIPILQDTSSLLDILTTKYASKWDALRTFREGTYYFTCKYPFQILPFADYYFDTNTSARYASLYATARFKIEVYGECIEYTKQPLNTSNYTANRYNDFLRSGSALLSPIDNRTFPHRRINIDLYMQDITGVAGLMANTGFSAEESYTFTWRLLATNHPKDFNDSNQVVYLSRENISSGLVFKSDLPLFFSKNYLSPFFIAKTEKTSTGTITNPASSDDDLIAPIKINPSHNSLRVISYVPATGVAVEGVTYYTDSKGTVANPQPNWETSESVEGYYVKVESLDRIEISSEADLDHLILSAGRSYSLLWDYTGNLSEATFTENVYSQKSAAQKELAGSEGVPTYTMTSSEKENFARLVDITDTSNPSAYSYVTDGINYNRRDTNILGKTSGYHTTSTKYVAATVYTGLVAEDQILTTFSTAVTGYERCSILDYNPSYTGEEGIVYYDSDTEKHYIWDIDEDNPGVYVYVEITPEVLDINEESTLKSYYENNGDPYQIYVGIVSLDDIVFEDDGTWYVWTGTSYLETSVITIDTVADLPYPGTTDSIYYVSEDTDYYKCTTSKAHFTGVSLDGASPFYFGNPYARSSNTNYLLSVRNIDGSSSRYNIENSYYFPYTPTEIRNNNHLSAAPIVSEIPASRNALFAKKSFIQFNEIDVIKNQYNRMLGNMNAARTSLLNSKSGIFTALSKAYPNYIYTSFTSGTVAENTYIRETSSTIHAYHASDRIVPSKNTNIPISRRGLYSNNLISLQEYDNSSVWSWHEENIGTAYSNFYNAQYVSDSDWDKGLGKDVYEVEYFGLNDSTTGILYDSNEVNPLLMEYVSGTQTISAAYETAINLKVLSNEDYAEKIYQCVESSGSYIYSEVSSSRIHYLSSESLLPSTGVVNGDIYIYKANSTCYIYSDGTYVFGEDVLAEGYFYVNMQVYDTTTTLTSEDLSKIYVKSPVNLLRAFVYFMKGETIVGEPKELTITAASQSGSLASSVVFADQWYVASYEADYNVAADHVAFGFVVSEVPGEDGSLTFRLTKAIVRRSSVLTHALGLSDGVYTTSTSSNTSNVSLSGFTSIVYRDNSTKELIPIQFRNTLQNRQGTSRYDSASLTYPVSGLQRIKDFVSRYSLGFPTSTSKLETLFNPWMRRLHFRRTLITDYISGYFYDNNFWEDIGYTVYIEPNIEKCYYDLETEKYYRCRIEEDTYLYYESVPFDETVYFTGYEVSRNDLGITSRVLSNIPVTDVFSSCGMSYIETSSERYLTVDYMNINTTSSSLMKYYNTNLEITSEYIPEIGESGTVIAGGPVTLTNETLSALINCFNPKNYRAGNDSLVSVTNIQFLAKPEENGTYERILYELEYLPLIYKENNNHLSVNTIVLRD